MAVSYYHFTSEDNLPSIMRSGISRGDVPTSPVGGFQAPWLTLNPNPQQQHWSMGGSKTQVRLTVEIPDDEAEKLWPWLELAKEAETPEWWLDALNQSGGGGDAYWLVFLGVIKPEWITNVERV
jgi:hypothetical protein